MRLHVLFFLIIILFSHCNGHVSKRNAISRIEVAKGGCLRRCPATAISIDSSLTFNYFGGDHARLEGNYTGKVTGGFWDSLNMKLERVNYRYIDTTEYFALDEEQAEVIYYWGGSKRRITLPIDRSDTTDYKSILFRELAYSYDHIKLHKVKENIKFEVKYQYTKEPILKEDTVKFPPPKP
jgi:hypothetical protein